jgi:cytochrome P450
VQPEEVLSLDEIDLSDLDFWELPLTTRDGAFRTLRRERPLAHFEEPDFREQSVLAPAPGPGFRAITRYADILEVSRHPEIYRSGQGAFTVLDLPQEMLDYFGGMVTTDDPRHARLRRIVSAAFNPKMVAEIENHIQEIATKVVEAAGGLGECDFVTEVAAPLPLRVICEMLGIPASEHDAVLRHSNVILSSGDPEYVPLGSDLLVAYAEAGEGLTELMHALSAERLEHPTDDLTSALINTNIDGEALTHAELASFFIELVVAGNETIRNAIAHGLWALTQNPDQRAIWRADLDGVSATAVEEIVRWASPISWMRRTVAEDTILAGQALHQGDKVLLFYNSANRDEDVFEDPYRFDVRRSPNPHLGFGAPGPHFCLGVHLARREISVMFRELLTRLPGIRATAEPDRLRSDFLNGIKHLACATTEPRHRPVAPATALHGDVVAPTAASGVSDGRVLVNVDGPGLSRVESGHGSTLLAIDERLDAIEYTLAAAGHPVEGRANTTLSLILELRSDIAVLSEKIDGLAGQKKSKRKHKRSK